VIFVIVIPDTFNRFLRVNMAGFWNRGEGGSRESLWLWNLACEGTTVRDDFNWLPFLENLHPDRLFVMRGAVENLCRPIQVFSGQWPAWVPNSWRHYAGMDPRCYFSTTFLRRSKQVLIDRLKQRVRKRLISRSGFSTLIKMEEFEELCQELFQELSGVTRHLHVLGMTPIGDDVFPGSSNRFRRANDLLRAVAARIGAEFLDWRGEIEEVGRHTDLFYRDKFHPNIDGARVMATVLAKAIGSEIC